MDAPALAAESLSAPAQALLRVINIAGTQEAAANWVGVTQAAISKRVVKRQAAAPSWVIPFERETGISRHELRPDIYPVAEPAPASAVASTVPVNAGRPSSFLHLGVPVR